MSAITMYEVHNYRNESSEDLDSECKRRGLESRYHKAAMVKFLVNDDITVMQASFHEKHNIARPDDYDADEEWRLEQELIYHLMNYGGDIMDAVQQGKATVDIYNDPTGEKWAADYQELCNAKRAGEQQIRDAEEDYDKELKAATERLKATLDGSTRQHDKDGSALPVREKISWAGPENKSRTSVPNGLSAAPLMGDQRSGTAGAHPSGRHSGPGLPIRQALSK